MVAEFFKKLPELKTPKFMPNNETLAKAAVEASKTLIELNAKYANELLQNSIDVTSLYVEGCEKLFDAAKHSQNGIEFTDEQIALFQEYRSKLSSAAQTNMKLVQSASSDYQAWLRNNVETASEEFREWLQQNGATPEQATEAVKPVAKKKATAKPAAKKTTAKKAADGNQGSK